ncbi:hypothetical protein SAY86_008292 [Trapa natans]|uniref:pectinesterase n=1 Tax=Trapa natans TaxID=22666 RepID=A0AAN7KCN0_TRANT|nr:hypothetical protein SAY86_008292 [Trapa natans]
MASFSSSYRLLPLLLFLLSSSPSLLFFSSVYGSVQPSAISAGSICQSTPDPKYCRSVLPMYNTSADGYFYGRYTVRKSLSQSQKFLQLVDKFLARRSSLTPAAAGALEDCRFLGSLNMDFLSTSFRTVNSTSNTLPQLTADDIQTLLSAILTNVETCVDGLQTASSAWSVRNGLTSPLSNDTKLYSTSLALFNKVWVPKKKVVSTAGGSSLWRSSAASTNRFALGHGQLSFSMSDRARAVFDSARARRRQLLQTNDGTNYVVVSDIVVVSQDGTGNFSTINDAISAAPNNSAGTDGYFVIYVTAGIYEEYVSIAKNKKYLMLIGDGINQTVITGNRSVVDGWTTFNSATFGNF